MGRAATRAPAGETETRTVCPYCGVGCGLVARTAVGRLRSVEGDPIYPVNRGRTCRKPRELPAAVHAADRAQTPLLRERRDGRFHPSEWDAIMPELAGRLRAIVDAHGPDAIAFYLSGQLLTEDYYAAVKLAKGFLGTNNVDSNSRLCMASAVAGYSGAFGSDGPPPAYADIEQADCFLLLGTNTAACHPIVWSRIQDRQREGATVICADPRRTATARGSDLHLPVRCGADLALLNAMLGVLDREELVDRDFVARHTRGWEEAVAVAREWAPERAQEVCGVPAADIEAATRHFAAGRSLALWSMGANQSSAGTLKNRALINLCLAAGQLGKPGCGPFSLTGQPNAMGGRESGGAAQTLPGYRLVQSEADRAEMTRRWDLPDDGPGISPRPGLTAVDLFHALEAGEVKAVWIVATNPVVSMPEAARARAALERAELVVVQDAYHPTETSTLAHAVLPAAAWLEKDGTMTNSERRAALMRKALDPPGAALPDWRIFQRLARELGFGEHFAWARSSEVFDELAALTSGRVCDQSGLSHELLARHGGIQWPFPAATQSADGEAETVGQRRRKAQGGSPLRELDDEPRRLYEGGRFPTPDGRARFAPTPHAGPAEMPDGDFPLTLTTGRVANHWHTLTRTGKSDALRSDSPDPFLELHPGDAEQAGVEDGEQVRLVSRRGEASLRAVLDPSLPRGICFAPMHWGALHAPAGSGWANTTTSPAKDPTSSQPELKAAAVRVEPLIDQPRRRRPSSTEAGLIRVRGHRPRRRRLVVVGTGMSGLRVAEEVLDRSPTAFAVTMLGEEPGPTYNRILLSKVLARTAGPEDVELRPRSWYSSRDVDLRGGSPAQRVDLERRRVIGADGSVHAFDALVLATGSRPFVPPIPGAERPHVHAFRTAADARAIATAADRSQRAVVVGGGLLGLEAAAGLLAHDLEVAVVEVADRLMPAQLDHGAARALGRALAELGVQVMVGRRVEEIAGGEVVLDGGEALPADLVVVAAGVRPETSLAAEAGIAVGRGILVDDELRTDAPGVWAVGECAEHRGEVYGLWAPLAEQARAAGAAVVGDPGGFAGAAAATTLKIAGVDLFTGGPAAAAGDQDELLYYDSRSGVYRKLVVEGRRLVGAVVVGDARSSRRLTELLRTGTDLPPGVIAPEAAGEDDARQPPDEESILCSCTAKTRGEVLGAIRGEALATLAEVAAATGASTGCGSCSGDVEELLAGHSSARNTQANGPKPEPATIE